MKMDIREDLLMHELLNLIYDFEQLANLAPKHLSEDWIKKHGSDQTFMPSWQDVLFRTARFRKKLEDIINDNSQLDLDGIDSKLGYARGLSRYLEEHLYFWTAYEKQIEEVVRKIFKKVREIDKKYTLGQERMKEMMRKRRESRGEK